LKFHKYTFYLIITEIICDSCVSMDTRYGWMTGVPFWAVAGNVHFTTVIVMVLAHSGPEYTFPRGKVIRTSS
jgi:hypothetical protein